MGPGGPVILEVEELARAVSVRPAATGDLPLGSSATECAYAAFMPEDRFRTLIAAELAPRKRAAYLGQLTEVRRRGIARSLGEHYPGLNSFSAPIFDADGGVVLAVTAFGLAVNFPGAWDSGAAKTPRDARPSSLAAWAVARAGAPELKRANRRHLDLSDYSGVR